MQTRVPEDLPAVGIVGLGLLGSAVAERLLAAGCAVSACDCEAARGEAWTSTRLSFHALPPACLAEVEVAFFCLPDGGVVRRVIEAHLSELRPGLVVFDMTTASPDEMRWAERQLATRGIRYLEANVAGSSTQLAAGAATLLVAGDEQVAARWSGLLDRLATARHFLGKVGRASSFKLVHNLVLGLHRAVLAEGLAFAEASGFTPEVALALLSETPARSAVMATKGPKMASRDYTPQARLGQHLKDVRLMLEEAARHGLDLPLTRTHRQLLETAQSLGYDAADNVAIIEAYRRCGRSRSPADESGE